MSHTYATVTQFKDYLADGGSTSLGTTNDANYLALLESASRRVDAFCGRSRFGSGFGPRIGTNRYDPPPADRLDLGDDLISVSTASYLDYTGGTATTLTVDTDVYLRGDNYDQPPYREIELTYLTTAFLGAGVRTVSVAGTWGYQNITRASAGTASGTALPTSATLATSATDLAIGMTLLVGAEQMYVRGLSGGTATVDRGANGSTAGTVVPGTAIAWYLYPPEVRDATIRVAQRRWKMRDAGLAGDFGGGIVPGSEQRDSERSILYATVGHLRVLAVG